MATAQHTPLPWHQRLNKLGARFIIEAESQKEHKQALVAGLDWWTSNEGAPDQAESEANAAFIVRACNAHYKLLNAAKRVMEALEQYGASIVPHLMDTDDNAGQELRNVIAELEGK